MTVTKVSAASLEQAEILSKIAYAIQSLDPSRSSSPSLASADQLFFAAREATLEALKLMAKKIEKSLV